MEGPHCIWRSFSARKKQWTAGTGTGMGLSVAEGIAAPVRPKVLMVLRLRAPPFRIYCRPYNTSQASTNKIGQDSRWPGWQVVIGIETHAQIKSREKLFSRRSV